MVGSGRGWSPAERGAGPVPVTREVLLPFAGLPPTPASSHCPLCWFSSSFLSWPFSSAGAFPMLGTVLAQWGKEVGQTTSLPTSLEVKCRREGTSSALGSWP